MVSEMKKLCGEIISQAVTLNCAAGIDAFVCLRGDTGVISVDVEENKTLVYSRKEFISNIKKVEEMKKDIQKMIDYRRRKFNGK